MWNASSNNDDRYHNAQPMYLICYAKPVDIIAYDFLVERKPVAQLTTHMHVSGESHTAYIYKRQRITSTKQKKNKKKQNKYIQIIFIIFTY